MAAVPQQPKTLQRHQWWKEEIKEEKLNSDGDTNKISIDTNKVKEFADALTEQVVVPTVGTTYKVEVQGTLETDGRFWACPLTSGSSGPMGMQVSDPQLCRLNDDSARTYFSSLKEQIQPGVQMIPGR